MMAGLNDVSSSNPAGTEVPTSGDDRIRALTYKVIEFAAIAHTLDGKHKFSRGPLASRPAAGNSGDLYILEVAGLLAELQYDTGSAWVTLTSRNNISDFLGSLSAHQTANPIDHPSSSVTAAKILAGAIQKKHLEGGSDGASISALVDGSSADALHVHDQYETAATVTPGDLTGLSAGEVIFGSSVANKSITSAMVSYTKVKEIQTLRGGTVTVKFNLNGLPYGLSNQIYKAAIYINGVLSGTERTINVNIFDPVSESYSENFVVLAEDRIQIYAKWETFCEPDHGYVSNFLICGNWDCIVNLE
uniref:Uncharacterized protein n=1 Tax=viral metagenome TaxID=1070528 RepID=A0A6M3IFK1_9ZZZZ